jgi:hypothetical protein
MASVREWLNEGFRKYALFGAYWKSVKRQGWEIAWGDGILAIAFCIWTLVFQVSFPAVFVFFGGVFLVASYHAWRDEYLQNLNTLDVTLRDVEPSFTREYDPFGQPERTRVYVNLSLAVSNASERATVVTDWQLSIPALGFVEMHPQVFSDDYISTHPIESGARKFCEVRCRIKDADQPEALTQRLRTEVFEWLISYADVKHHRREQSFLIGPLKAK